MIHKKQKQSLQLFFVKILIVVMNTGLFMLVWNFYYRSLMYKGSFGGLGNYVMAGLYFYIYAIMAKLYKGLELRTSRVSELIYSQVIAIFITGGVIYIVTLLLTRRIVNIFPLFLQIVISCGISTIWSFFANQIANRIYKPAKVLLAYDNGDAYKNGRLIIDKLPWRFEAVGEVKLPDVECWIKNYSIEMSRFVNMLQESHANAVMLCGLASSLRNDIVKYCVKNDIQVYVRPNIGDFIISNSEIVQMANLPVLICEKHTPSLIYAFIKRAMDIVIAFIGVIVTSPILLFTAILIKAYDGGPVLYKQVRLTKDGKKFSILKFRSMRVDAEKDGVARLSCKGDSRITPIGKLIRACRIDELPQLFNIIRGHLSIVGPRPERPEIAEQYEKEMPEFALRLQVKAGLTGYAQIYGKYNTEPYDKLQMDLLYIAKQGIVSDLKIILGTIKVLLMPESTEGIAEGAMTAMQSREKGWRRNKEEVRK